MECNFDGNTDRLFCLGAYYFFKSSRKRSKIKELTFEDNVVEQDRLACMWEEGLTDPLAEQTRHKALTEIIGQEKAIRALRAALCGPNPLLGSVHDPIYQGGGGVLAGGHPPAQTGCGLRDARRHSFYR